MPRRQCQHCSRAFDARRSDAKYCTPRCRQQAFQHAKRTGERRDVNTVRVSTDRSLFDAASAENREALRGSRDLVDAVRAELDTFDALNTVDGMAALQTAEHLCRNTISGTERTSLTKTLAEIMQRVASQRADLNDPVEQIRARWRARRSGAPIAAAEFIINGRTVDNA